MKPAIVALLLFVSTASRVGAQDARLEQIVQEYVKQQTFMGAVLVARGGDVVLNKGFGLANIEWDVPNTPTTKFRLGSITKQFTAASILLLQERGKLSVDDRIRQHLPDAPAAWDAITIRHLLTHTSGIPNFTALPEYQTTMAMPSLVEKTIATFRDKPLDFAPGEQMRYSNSGYLVLGHLIEKLSGGSYGAFVQANLFAPAGMKDSGYDAHAAIIPRRASGYVANGVTRFNAPFLDMTIPHAAGGLYSTTEDLLRWEQALFGGRILSTASLQQMTTPVKNNYAFGLVVQTIDGRKIIHHNGGINGFNTELAYYPDTKIVVVVLGNLNGRAPEQIAGALGVVAHGGQLPATGK